MKKIIIYLFLSGLIFSGCGRRQKNIFYFPQRGQEELKINKLSLPYAQQVHVEKTNDGNKISWSKVKINGIELNKKIIVPKLLGYNVYRLVNCIFVPKKPINEKLIKDTNFLDTQILQKEPYQNNNGDYYLVRAVFEIENKTYSGPFSQIVCVK